MYAMDALNILRLGPMSYHAKLGMNTNLAVLTGAASLALQGLIG
jgi:hypothetical protein